MLVGDLIELSALLAVNGTAFVLGNDRLSDAGIYRYWEVSRLRFARWQQTLRQFQIPTVSPLEPMVESRRPRLLPVLEEIFTTEVLTRTWTAIACEYDLRRKSNCATPVAKSVLLSHLDARNRAMNVMVQSRVRNIPAVADLDRLRRRAERWTDMLLAHLFPACHIDDLTFDYRRALDFAEEFYESEPIVTGGSAWELMVSGLKAAFRGISAAPSLNEDLNRQVVASILACFESSAFESIGMLKSLWMDRMNHAADDTLSLIDQLLAIDGTELK